MTDQASASLGPTELLDAVNSQPSGGNLPGQACQMLLSLGSKGRGDFTWGIRTYRTSYTKTNSDADFAKAIEVLNEYMRLECFSYSEEERDHADLDKPVNGKANRQLWRHLENDIVQDPERLEGASVGAATRKTIPTTTTMRTICSREGLKAMRVGSGCLP